MCDPPSQTRMTLPCLRRLVAMICVSRVPDHTHREARDLQLVCAVSRSRMLLILVILRARVLPPARGHLGGCDRSERRRPCLGPVLVSVKAFWWKRYTLRRLLASCRDERRPREIIILSHLRAKSGRLLNALPRLMIFGHTTDRRSGNCCERTIQPLIQRLTAALTPSLSLKSTTVFSDQKTPRFRMADRVRSATINRDTNETKIQLSLNLDGGVLEDASENSANGEAKSHAAQTSKSQTIDVDSGIGFLDHMIHALAKHAGWSLRIRCRGDLHSTCPLLRSPLHEHHTPCTKRHPY